MEREKAPLGLLHWVADHELYILLAAAPALLFPELWLPYTLAALAVLPLLWAARWAARGRLTVRTPLDLPILGIMVMLGVSVLVSMAPDLSLSKATGLLLGIGLYYGMVNSRGSLSLLNVVPLLAWGVIVLGLMGTDWVGFKLPFLAPIYRFFPRLISGVPRTMAGGFHPNEVGGTLAMLLPLLVGWWMGRAARPAGSSRPSRLSRIYNSSAIAIATIVVGAVVLVLTQSRTALMATIGALILTIALQVRAVRWLAGLAGVRAILALIVMGSSTLLERLFSIPGSYTWAGRPEIWRNALQAINDYPLTGVGLNAFAPVTRLRYTYTTARPPWDFVHAHNILLQTGSDLGLLGLISFVALVVVFFALCLHMWAGQQRAERWITAGLMGGMAAYLLFGTIDTITLGAKPALLIWFITGLAIQLKGRQSGLEAPRPSRVQRVARVAIPALVMLAVVASFWFDPALSSLGLSNWAQLMLNRGQPALAVPLLEKAIDLYPANGSAKRALADAYAYQGQRDEAISAWQAIGVSPAQVSAKGESLLYEGKLDEAAQYQEWALVMDPNLGDTWYRLALVRQQQGRLKESRAALENAEVAGNLDAFSTTDIARRKLMVMGASEEESVELPAPLRNKPTVQAANELVDKGQLAQAVAVLRLCLERDPNNARAWMTLGKARIAQRRWEDAIAALERSLELDPVGYWANHLLASVYATRQEWDEVIRLEEVAIQEAPSAEQKLASEQRQMQAYEKLAEASQEPAQGINQESLDALQVDNANALLDNGQVADALVILKPIVERNPGYASAWVTMAKAQMAQQDWEGAITSLEKARKLEPKSFWANHLLASLYSTRRDWAKVAELENLALRAAPNADLRLQSALALLDAYDELGDKEKGCALLDQIRAWPSSQKLLTDIGAEWSCGQ